MHPFIGAALCRAEQPPVFRLRKLPAFLQELFALHPRSSFTLQPGSPAKPK